MQSVLRRLFNEEYKEDKRCCQGFALPHGNNLLLDMCCLTSYQPPECDFIRWLVRSEATTSQHTRQELLAVFISRV